MSEEPPADVDSCTELDFEDGVPQAASVTALHEYREVEQSLCLDIHKCAVYDITLECRDCSMTRDDVEIVGSKPRTAPAFNQVVYDLYESLYENPRSIPYYILQVIAPAEEARFRERLAEFLAEAVDLGCRDAENDQDKRTRREVLEVVLPEHLRVL